MQLCGVWFDSVVSDCPRLWAALWAGDEAHDLVCPRNNTDAAQSVSYNLFSSTPCDVAP